MGGFARSTWTKGKIDHLSVRSAFFGVPLHKTHPLRGAIFQKHFQKLSFPTATSVGVSAGLRQYPIRTSAALVAGLCELVGDLLVQNFAHREQHDHPPGLPEEAADLRHRIAGIVEGNEKSFLTHTGHHGLKRVDVRTADLLVLFHLDRVSTRALDLAGGIGEPTLANTRWPKPSIRVFHLASFLPPTAAFNPAPPGHLGDF